MKVVGHINDVHKDTRPRKLNTDEVVRYQLLTGQPNPDAEARKTNPLIFPFSNTIPAQDRIWDVNKKEHVDIALVESYDKDKNITPKRIDVFGKNNGGQFACTGGKVTEEELYEYLELTNFNASNPNRDASIEPIFKRIDDLGDAKLRSTKRNSLLEALQYVKNMTNGDVREFAAARNWDENLPYQILRDKIETFAESAPEEFKIFIESKDREVKATIKRAIDAGKIAYDSTQHRISMNNQTLIKMDRVEGVDFLSQAADWIATHRNGTKVFDQIKKLIATE